MATIQIRNVPDAVAKKLKVRAAQRGQSLQEYMLQHLKEETQQPTAEELFDEIESRRYRRDDMSAEEVVNAIHDAREERTGRIVSLAEESGMSGK